MSQKKHPSSKFQENLSSHCLESDLAFTAVMKLEPLILKRFFQKSIFRLGQEECCSDVTLSQGPSERGSLVMD